MIYGIGGGTYSTRMSRHTVHRNQSGSRFVDAYYLTIAAHCRLPSIFRLITSVPFGGGKGVSREDPTYPWYEGGHLIRVTTSQPACLDLPYSDIDL